MVTCWAIAPALIATAIALPVGAVLEPVVARAVVSAQADPAENINPLIPGAPGGAPGAATPGLHGAPARYASPPPGQPRGKGRPGPGSAAGQGLFSGVSSVADQDPYTVGELALLALAGLAIAIAGALGPAASRTTTALRAE